MNNKTIIKKLFESQDLKYRDFQCKLIPNVPRENVIGVRTPVLRAIAKEYDGTNEAKDFIAVLPHEYYEENKLHGFLIERIKDYDRVICEIDRFLPYVDNWATCDLMSPKVFAKHKTELYEKIKEWIANGRTFTVRFGIEMLMLHFLDGDFTEDAPKRVASVKSDEYYVRMMQAWYFATALAKQYDSVIGYIEKKKLEPWTHNKAIQKAIESYRITDEKKTYLHTLKL